MTVKCQQPKFVLLSLLTGISLAGAPGCEKTSSGFLDGRDASTGPGPVTRDGDIVTPPARDGDVADVPPAPTFSKRALIEAIATCTADRYQAFQASATVLQARITAYAGTLLPADLIEAQKAWRDAMALWQEAELFQFGPAGLDTAANTAGLGLRLQIYSYPAVFRCGIDRGIVSQAYGAATFPTLLVTVRGLAALEYLLFYTGANNQCAPGDLINKNGTWAAIDAPTLARRRADYAVAAINDVMTRLSTLLAAWSPGAANFRRDFVMAGAGQKPFVTEQSALNIVAEAILNYTDHAIKDDKVGKPSGIDLDCLAPPCTDALESPYAVASTDNLVHNLLGLRRIFNGCGQDGAGLGFDDWLRAVGRGTLADRMETALSGALQSAQTLQPPLESAILVAPIPAARVQALHTAIKQFNDPLKSEMFSALDLVRSTMETDND